MTKQLIALGALCFLLAGCSQSGGSSTTPAPGAASTPAPQPTSPGAPKAAAVGGPAPPPNLGPPAGTPGKPDNN